MDIICSDKFKIDSPTAVCIGKFDGIHLGHQKIISSCLEEKKNGLKTLVFTFNPTPFAFFNPGAKEIMTIEEKRRKFERLGVDILVEFPFNSENAAISAGDFLSDILVKMCHAKVISSGADLSFGFKGLGNIRFIEENKDRYGIEQKIIDKAMLEGVEISSTYIRELIEKGEINKANMALGDRYSVCGEVVEGRKLGRTLDFPTANIIPDASKLLPARGVYSSRVIIKDDIYNGISNVGCKPTVNSGLVVNVETFIKDFDKDIYGQKIKVELVDFIRPEKKFNSIEELKAQVKKDIEFVLR